MCGRELELEPGGQLWILDLGVLVIHSLNSYPLPSSLYDDNLYYSSLFWGPEIQVGILRMAHLCSMRCLPEWELPRCVTTLTSDAWAGKAHTAGAGWNGLIWVRFLGLHFSLSATSLSSILSWGLSLSLPLSCRGAQLLTWQFRGPKKARVSRLSKCLGLKLSQ